MPGALLGGSDLSLADRIESQLQSLSEHRRLGHSLVEQAEPLDALELPLDAPSNHIAPATQRTPSGERARRLTGALSYLKSTMVRLARRRDMPFGMTASSMRLLRAERTSLANACGSVVKYRSAADLLVRPPRPLPRPPRPRPRPREGASSASPSAGCSSAAAAVAPSSEIGIVVLSSASSGTLRDAGQKRLALLPMPETLLRCVWRLTSSRKP